jgi:hypothetical protein
MTYKQICDELVTANEWLSSLGIREHQDRQRQHIRRIEQLEEARQAGNLADATRGDAGRLSMFSLTEAIEFLDVYDAFSQGHPDELPDRIRQALDGPADLGDESPKSSLGRNIMFELNLAARLKVQGSPVALPLNPDILTEIDGRPLNLQCKRPFRPETIPGNIHDAEKQLVNDLRAANNPEARGVIAISVSRLLNRGDQLFVGPDESTIKQRLGDDVQILGEKYRDVWGNVADVRIIGILFHLITPTHIQDINLLTVGQQTVVFPLPIRPRADEDLMRHFAYSIGNN